MKFIKDVGSKVLNLLNGVKLTTEQFSKAYSIPEEELNSIIANKTKPTKKLIEAFRKHPALRVSDLYEDNPIVEDNTTDGVVVVTSKEMDATARKAYRGGHHFYTYKDTAMSKTSLFRPEWISVHYNHNGKGDIGEWAFNKGHFEHQITYFIGKVNFHWIANGKQHVRQMNTGDINYITPFVPHTFTVREGKGLILAVTYGGSIATAEYQSKISKLTQEEFINLELPEIIKLSTDKLGGVLIKRSASFINEIPFQTYSKVFVYKENGRGKCSESETWCYNIGKKQ